MVDLSAVALAKEDDKDASSSAQSDTIPPTPSDPSLPSSSDTNSSLDAQRPELKQMADENKQAISEASSSTEVQRPESSIPADSAIDISSSPPEQSASSEASASASVTTSPNETNKTNESTIPVPPSEVQRPVSLEMADESKIPIPEAATSAENQRPDSYESADLSADISANEDEQKVASPSAQLEEKPIESEKQDAQPQQAEASTLPQTSVETAATNVADHPSEPQAASENSPEKPPEIISTADEIDVQPPHNQATQVQPEPSESASRNDTDQVASPSASFIPEPLEQPQEAPISNIDSQNSSQKSFGDLLSKENSSPSIPLTSPKPPISPLPVDLSTDLPKPYTQSSSSDSSVLSQSPLSPISPQPSEPQVIENPAAPRTDSPSGGSGTVVEKIVEQVVKVVDEQEVQRLYEQRLKERQQEIRERGRIVKAQKRDTRFDKILIFAQQKHSFDNQDIRDLLHISQSAVSVYLSELVKDRKLIREGKSKYITYHLP